MSPTWKPHVFQGAAEAPLLAVVSSQVGPSLGRFLVLHAPGAAPPGTSSESWDAELGVEESRKGVSGFFLRDKGRFGAPASSGS